MKKKNKYNFSPSGTNRNPLVRAVLESETDGEKTTRNAENDAGEDVVERDAEELYGGRSD